VLAKRGRSVTVIEAQDPVLARVTGMALWRFYEAEHRAHDGDISLATAVSCIEGNDRATGVRLADGSLMLADMVIVGIGIVPAVEPLLAASTEVAEASRWTRSAAPCCRMSMRSDTARCTATRSPAARRSTRNRCRTPTTWRSLPRAVAGEPVPYHAVPWSWSNQYDLRRQTVALSTGHDRKVLRGNPADAASQSSTSGTAGWSR